MVVPSPLQHTHDVRSDEKMKQFQVGNSTIIIHSKLVVMTSEQKKKWFDTEKAKGNPILKEIERAVNDCYR